MRYRFTPFLFDAGNARLEGPQGEIPLRPMTLKLLRCLLEHAPDLLGHDELLDRVWGRQAVTPGVLSQSVRELRRALGDTAQASVYIETRHKLGYRFAAPVERLADEAGNEAPAMPAQTPVAGPAAAPLPRFGRRWILAATSLALLVLATAAAGLLHWRGTTTATGGHEGVEVVHDGRPREPSALRWYRDGLEALAAHDPVRAQEQFERALQREPESVAALAGLVQALAERGEMARARELAAPLRDAAANLPREAQLRIGAFLARIDQRPDEALRQLTALSALNPGDADAGVRLAALQIETGRIAEAATTLAHLQSLPRHDPARLALLRARLAGIRGDHPAWLAAAREAGLGPANTPLHAEALLEQGRALQSSGDIAGAGALRDTLDSLPGLAGWPAIGLRAALFAASLERDGGRIDDAGERFRAIAGRARELGLPAMEATARREAAHVKFMAGRYDEALAELEDVQQQQARLGDPRALASTLGLASLVQQRRGEQDAAGDLAVRALAAWTDSGDLAGEASARNTLGMLHSRTGRHAEAQQQWDAALALFERIGNRRGAATALGNLAIGHGHAGRTAAAREANETALEIFREVGATADVARLQFNLGVQDRNAGDLVQAERRLAEALQGFTTLGAESFRLQATATLAELRLLRAETGGADALLSGLDAATLAPPERAAAIASAQARLSMLRGNLESAEAGFAEARNLRERAGLADWMRFSELDLAELAAVRGELAAAESRVRELRREMARHGDARAALQAGILLAAILHARGDADSSARLLDTLDNELVARPDAVLELRLDLVRAAQEASDRRGALARFATRARAGGFELLALRAERLGGNEARALERLQAAGIHMPGTPPALPY